MIIYDKDGIQKHECSISNEAVYKREIVGEHYVRLTFNTSEYISFVIGDYIVYEGQNFTIYKDVSPEENAGYSYDILFGAKEMRFINFMLFLNGEAEFTLTSNAGRFLEVVCESIERYTGEVWNVGSFVEGTKSITFSGQTIFDALTTISETFETEWWVDGNTVNLSKLEIGTEVNLVKGEIISTMESDGSDDRITRLYAFGSTKNIPEDYRGAVVTDGILQKRLKLPVDTPYIDAWEGMSESEVIEGIKFFEDVFPKFTLAVTEVRNASGIYFIKYSGITFLSEYLISDPLSLRFTSGSLNGQEFELTFHTPDEFEVIIKDSLPNATIAPVVGDSFVLFNFDIQAVSDQAIPTAETELKDESIAFMAYQGQDNSTYTCKTISKYCLDNTIDFSVGQKVALAGQRFKGGIRSSRIYAFEKKLLRNHICTYTVGDRSKYSRLREIEKSIQKVEYSEKTFTGGNGVYLISRYDNTTPSDTNTFSALRAKDEFVSKKFDDLIQGLLKVIKGLRSNNFNGGALGQGMSLEPMYDNEGNMLSTWKLIIDYLDVKKKATFVEIEIDKITHVGGTILLTPASMKCNKVEAIEGGYRCYFDNSEKPNTFVAGDQAICQVFSLPSTKRYWRYVMAVGLDYIDLSETDCEAGSDVPAAGDDIVQLGNRNNALRRGALILSSYGDAPSIAEYTDIGILYDGETSPYTLLDRQGTVIKPGDSEFTGKVTVRGGNGQKYRVPADRGDWTPGAYYYYDRVRYGNAQWLCLAIPSTTLEPSDANIAVWKKELSSGNGTPGNWVSQVFKESLEQPATPTGTDSIPLGWLDGPTGPGTWWLSKSTVNGATGLAGAWSVPVQVTGTNGTKTPFRFAKNTSLEVYPAIDVDNINPGEVWLVDPPALVDGEYLWMTKAEIRTMAQNAEGNVFDDIFSDEFWGAAALERIDQLVANWSVPVRISGEKGTDGKDGKDYEFIYTRTATSASPDTPETSQTDDYVPAGWTDNQIGVDSVNKLEWVSKRVKINGIWGAFSVPAISANWSSDGEDGDPGADALEASLSNSQHNIPSDSYGNNGNYSGAVCTMYIYKGVVDDSANWTVTITKSVGVSGTQNGKTYTITGLSTDNGYVDFTASRTGYPSILKRMTLTKSKSGEPGVTPTAYWLLTPPSIARNAAGAYIPATFSVYGYASASNTPSLYAGKFTISETEDGLNYFVKYASSNNEAGKTYTPTTASVKAFMIQLRKSVTDSTILDEQIVPVVIDGAPGAQGISGISYMLSANANVITKTVALSTVTYTPSTIYFYPRKKVGGDIPVAPSDCSLKIQGWNGTAWYDLITTASVTQLTYSQSVSATYSMYRAQLTLGAVLVQELVINVIEDAKSGKDALAYLVGGYSSYEAYVADATQFGKTLMAGGYLKNEIIDTVSLFAKALQISVIADLVGTQFDASLVTVTQKKGMTFPATVNGTDTNLNITPQSLPDLASFLAGASVTGSNYLTAFSGETWVPNGATYGDKTKISPSYQTIPTGVATLKWSAINLAATFTVPSGGSGDLNRKGGLWISLYAHFYNGTTYIGRQFMGTVGGMSDTRIYSLSGSIPAGMCATPINANRVYLYAQFSCSVEFSSPAAPTCTLSFTALDSSAYFSNATGIYRSTIAPDGYACARGVDDYIHFKAGTTKMTLNYQGDVISNSIQQKLVSCVFEANGTPRAYSGYGTRSSFTMNMVTTGVYRVVHNMGTSLGLNSNNYNIQATSEVGLVDWYLWPVSNNEFHIKTFNKSGVATNTVLHVSVTRM